MLELRVEPDVLLKFPQLMVKLKLINDLQVKSNDTELEKFKEEIIRKVRARYDLATLKDVAVFRVYRDFFWRAGIDPTKVRPAAEALIRRILGGNPLPQINTLVDAYNLASIETQIALAAFDRDRLQGRLTMRFAAAGEEFLGIGMTKPMLLSGGEVVVSDDSRLVAVYPYRDADFSKVTGETRNIVLMVCGVPGIDEPTLLNAGDVAVQLVTRFCDGFTQ